MEISLILSFLFLHIVSFISAQGINVALNQNASQLNTLDFNGFLWTADKVVDNCTSQDDPDNQQCCSASIGTTDNFIRVDFDKPYNISSIVVYGRDAAGAMQTQGFQLYIVNGSGTEVWIYDNNCCAYGNGIFTIPVNDTTVLSIIVTLPTENVLTVCEIQAFETIPVTAATVMPTSVAPTTSGQGQNATITSSNNQSTSSSQGQSTTQGQGQSSTMGQSGPTTGATNSAPEMLKYSKITGLFLLNALFVWRYL